VVQVRLISSPFLFDVAIGSLIFVALLWFHWLFKLGALVGLRADYIDGFEKVHYWMNYALFCAMAFDFLARVLVKVFRGD
jgi:hypothetical protein